ncbi:MAG: patatin-like phospholipase family protein [Anaerolineales bacterium]|nr:patatin-like phospholipase family protein [Anaerolineales bacterium]
MEIQKFLGGQIEKALSFFAESIPKRRPFRNLVFKGGGMRGAAYIGVLEVLDREGVLDQIERVAGASSGAITATLLSLRRDLAETLHLIETIDFSRVPQRKQEGNTTVVPLLSRKVDLSALEGLSSEVESANRLIRRYGWFSSEYVYHWMQGVIARCCNGNGMASFADFRAYGYRDLYIVVSNLSRRRSEVFSAQLTPDVSVADAVRLSMSIPLFFEGLQFDGKRFGSGDYYVDGGVFDNYPIHIFDDLQFAQSSQHYHNGINWETLGCYLYPNRAEAHPYEPITGLMSYMKAVVSSLYNAHQVTALDLNLLNQMRTIKIDDCGVDPTEFSLTREDNRYKCLVQSGREAAEAYLDGYNLSELLAA